MADNSGTLLPVNFLYVTLSIIDFMPPRQLMVEEFAQARVSEMDALITHHDALKTLSDVFNHLPRHLRRRTASHNSRARTLKRRLDTSKKKGNNRHQKRRKNVLKETKKSKWLETHIWNSKRMHMQDIWGYRLGMSCTQRGVRSAYKSYSKLCTIHDASYFSCIELTSQSENELKSFLRCVSCPDVLYDGVLKGRTEGEFVFCRDETPVGPVSILFNPENSCQLWLWVHVAIFDFIKFILDDLNSKNDSKVVVKSLRDSLLRFELRGPKSYIVLKQVLRVQDSNHIWKSLSGCENTVLGLKIDDPRKRDPCQPFKPSSKKSKISKTPVEIPSNAHASALWSEQNLNKFNKNFKECKAHFLPDGVSVMVVKKSNGWDLVLPGGWANAFWKALIYAGSRHIGILERFNLMHEYGDISFPGDFPDTKAGAMWEKHQYSLNRLEHERKPPAKRCNFSHFKIESPFSPDWGKLIHGKSTQFEYENSALKPVPIGNNEIQDSIRVLRGDMLLKLIQGVPVQVEGFLVRVILTAVGKGRFSDNAMICTVEDEKRVIGYVTHGFYSMRKAKGAAIGFCDAKFLTEIFSKNSPKIFVRNITSFEFYEALIEISKV